MNKAYIVKYGTYQHIFDGKTIYSYYELKDAEDFCKSNNIPLKYIMTIENVEADELSAILKALVGICVDNVFIHDKDNVITGQNIFT